MLFCSTIFGQKPNWTAPYSGNFEGNMTIAAYFEIYGEEQFSEDIEFAAFCGDELRGVGSKPTMINGDHYVSVMTIHGNNNDNISFKIWDPNLGEILSTSYTKRFLINDVLPPFAIDFYETYWNFVRNMETMNESMTIINTTSIDGTVLTRRNFELAAFYGNELRGVGRQDEEGRTYFTIFGDANETGLLTFKLYDHKTDQLMDITGYSIPFEAGGIYGDYDNPEMINFSTKPFVAKVENTSGNTYYTTLEAALKALTENATLTILEDITISSDWDCRNTGAKITVPVTINGNGKTIKFTGKIYDANWNTLFRFENVATVKNLTLDASAATQVQRGISAKSSVTVENCTLIGNGGSAIYAVIVGEGAGAENIGNVTANITNSTFKNWTNGVTDNMNGQDMKEFAITGCTFDNTDVVISAKENVTFTGNNMSGNSYVNISSYSVPNNVQVVANNNTNLAANTETECNQIAAPLAKINAQDGFLKPVAEAGGKYYVTLQGAVDAAKSNETVTMLADVTPSEQVVINKSIILDLNNKTITGTGATYRPLKVAGNNSDIAVTIKNGTVKTENVTTKPEQAACVLVYDGADVTFENVVMNGSNYGVLMAGYNEYATGVSNNNITSIVVNGENTNIKAVNAAIIAQGAYPNISIQINAGNVESTESIAIYQPTKGDLTINGGTITGSTAVYVKAGDLKVNGGTIIGNGEYDDYEYVESGATSTGDAIVIESCNHGYYGAPTALIEGGVINSTNAAPVASYQYENNEQVKNFISGGTFNKEIASDLIALGYKLEANTDGTYGVVVDPEYGMQAKIVKDGTTTYYTTIADAITAAQPGETVTILDGEYTDDITINKAITVVGETDEHGNKLVNITGRVSAYTGATVKNLNVNNTKTGDNDCALNVNGNNIVVDGVNLTGYNAMRYCYASGDITIKNSTINGSNFAVHFDGSAGGNIVFENTDITGWASYASTVNSVSYTNCKFDQGGYAGHRYYNKNISFNECTFNAGLLIDLRASGSNVAFTDADMTVAEVKALFKDPYYVANGNVTLNGNPVLYAASANSKYYNTLQECIDDLPADGTNWYVTLRSDNVLTAPITIPADKKMTFALNGFDITYTSDVQGEAMITNNGVLTIEGRDDDKVTYKFTGTPDTSYGKGNYTIYNNGTLTVESGIVENTTEAMSHASYAINTGAGATLNIKGGKVLNLNGHAVRMVSFGTNVNNVNITGGYIEGTRALQVQLPEDAKSTTKPEMNLSISGGELKSNEEADNLAIYVYSNGQSAENLNVAVAGGTFNGNVAINKVATKTMKEDAVKVTNGTFNGTYGVFSYADNAVAVPVISITGGTFATDYSEAYALDDGYEFVKDETTGRFGLQQLQGLTISTLNELIAFRNAVNAGNTFAGQTVVLSDNVNLAPTRAAENWIPIGTNENPFLGTFDGGNFTISNLTIYAEDASDLGLFGRFNAPAVIKNINIKDVNIKGQSNIGAVVGNGYTGTIDNCHVTGIIKLEGNYKVGGISGQGYAKINNSSVIATEDSESYVKASYLKPDLEGDNVGGIVGHTGEGKRDYKNNTVKNILVSGTRKVGGIAGIMHQTANFENNTVENVTVETTAEADYANSNLSTMSIGALIGQYYPAGSTNDGTVKECVVKNVKFSNVNNVTVDVGPIVGGARGGTNSMLAPSTDIVSEGNLVYMSTITGSNNLYLMNAVAKIGETEYYTLFDAVKAAQGETTTITLISNTSEEFAINNTETAITLDLNGNELTGAILPSNAKLTVKNGTINNNNSNVSAIEINAGTLNLEGVNIASARHAVRIDGAVIAEVNGGKYTLIHPIKLTQHAFNISGNANVIINGGKFVGPAGSTASDSGSAVNVQSGATVTINGGDFSGGKNHTLSAVGTLIVKGGTFDQDPSAYLAQGYVAEKTGNVWTVGLGVAKLNGVTYVSLQAAIDAAVVGDNAIQLLANIDGDVRVSQQEGVNITINGKISDTENYQFNGTVFVDGNSRSTGTETLTIQNINFYTADDSRDFISCNDGGNAVIRYAHNVTVRNCNFTATETSKAVLAMRFRQAYNIRVEGGNFKNLHSVMWATGVTGITVNGIVAENCKEGGLSLGTSTDLKVENVDIEGKLYGIRLGGNNNSTEILGGTLTVTGSKIKAKTPVLARNANSATTFTFNGTNVMTEENDANDYWCIICDGGYNGEETPTYPLGQVTVVLNDAGLSYDGVYGNYGVAKIGDVVYTTFNDAYNAATENNNVITLLADAVVDQPVAKPITINGNEKQLAGNMLVTSDVTFGGKLGLTNNVKVTNGATLTIAEGAEVTGAGTFFGAGSDNNYYGMPNSVTAAGTIKINGNVDIQQINANNAGVVTVAEGAKLTVDIVCAENGDMQNAVAGVMNISGNVETQRFNIFGGSTVNVNATGVVSSEQVFTSSNIEDVISIWGGAKLVVNGTVTCATIEHTGARHSKVNIGADGTLVVDKGGRFTCGGELKNAGELKVVLDCTAEVQSLTGNGKVTVDATYMTASEGLAVKADVTNFNGEITVVGGSYEKTSEGIYVRRTTEFFYTAAGVETTQDQAAYSLMFTITDNANKEVSVKIGSKKPANNSNARLVIPETVELDGINEAFEVTAIENDAFLTCYNFVGDLEIPATVKKIGTSAFLQAYSNTTIGKLTLHEGLETIMNSAFTLSHFNNDVLEIPSTVTFIGSHAFNATNMNGTLVINGNVNKVGGFHGFAGSLFTKVVIKEGVTELTDISNKGVFGKMAGLEEVVIPSSLTKLGAGAFSEVTTIRLITSNAVTAPTLGTAAFTTEVKENAVMLVHTDYHNYIINGQNWGGIKNIYGVKEIIKEGYSLLVKVNDNVCSVEIGDKPHQNDRIELELPRTIEYYGTERAVTSIAKDGFRSCQFFGTLTIPGNIETIADNAFNTCMQFNKLVIEEGVETIGNGSFNMCSNLKYISFPSTLESIGQNAFNVVYMENGGRIVSFAANPPTAYKHIYNQGINPVNPSFPQKLRDNAILYVFEESLDKYKSATGWEFRDVRPIEAKIGETYYLTLTEAIAAATSGQTITLLADVEAADGTPVLIPEGVTLDINTHNVTANIYGTVKTSGGLWTTVTVPGFNSRKMLGDGAIYNTTDATVANSASEVKMLAGSIVLNPNPETEWWTLPNQNLSIASGASFEVPANINFTVRENTHVVVDGTLTVNGVVYLQMGATVKAAAGLNILTDVEGYMVSYENGVYSVVQAIFTQTTQLGNGWNWFSYYVETDLAELENALGTNGLEIKSSKDGYVRYSSIVHNDQTYYYWQGGLSSISETQMYMINTSAIHTLEVSGNIVDSDQEIVINGGWTWIGYPTDKNVAINDALANLKPQLGDRIKTQDNGYAEYIHNETYNVSYWSGSLATLIPGEGYKYYSKLPLENTASFKYNIPSDNSKSELRANVTTDNNHWIPNAGQYANNMTMTAMVNVEGNYEIAAFVNGEVRGSARPIYVEALDSYIYFLTIHGDEVEEMSFRLYDLDTDIEYNLSDRMNYSDDAIVGSLTEPYMFNLEMLGIGENSAESFNIYPNPTTTNAEINLNATCDKVEVFNALGVKIAEYSNVDSIDAVETAGIYVIRVTNNNNVQHCRLIVK